MRDFGFQTSFASNAGVSRNATRCASPRSRNAFTLTEILIVLGIIVLMLAIAVPALNIIRGNRSVDSAVNQVSALLGRARSEAIGLQITTGVMFFRDPRTDQYAAALVRETPTQPRDGPPPPTNPLVNVEVFLDLTSEA